MSERFFRLQLNILKPFLTSSSLEVAREGQDRLGQLIASIRKKACIMEDITLPNFEAAMVTPKDVLSGGVVLYLHGGGYTCGDLDFAKGMGLTIAAKGGIRVFCPAYRLAPEAPFPAAVDDALASYKHLISIGYHPEEIVLGGESAGGGLVFALALKLKELGYAMPAGIIAISPWTDLTMSGDSFDKNKDVDPSITKERLEFYADCYVNKEELKKKGTVSPLFGDLAGLPRTLIFVGGDEVMLDDSRMMHEALLAAGCNSELVVKKGMWHTYVLFCMKEHRDDYERISEFLKETISKQKKLRWMRLDNAAKIYPAIKTREWNNFFRLSMTLNEEIDKDVLQSALDVTVRRFPSISVRLRRGMFWYYLEEVPKAPKILDECNHPLVRRPFDDIRKCAFRVIVYDRRIATEFFHAITDGNGGLVFLKTLVAEYLTQKHGVQISYTEGVLDRLEKPRECELEDSFLLNSGEITASRKEPNVYHIRGTKELDGFRTNTTFLMEAEQVKKLARERGVTVTSLLAAALVKSVISIQAENLEKGMCKGARSNLEKYGKHVRLLIPVNLRKLFPSESLRNFVLYIIAGVDSRLGEYTFDELCKILDCQMKLEVTEKEMRKRIAVNVKPEQSILLKIAPLFIKNIVMKSIFNVVGERKSCFSFSNLGCVKLPDEMARFVEDIDFVLGVQARAPYNIGLISFNGHMRMNFIRNIKEPLLEWQFFQVLRSLGINMKVGSNERLAESSNQEYNGKQTEDNEGAGEI